MSYRLLADNRLYWCNSHQRRATHVNTYNGFLSCDPNLGGILLPCDVVDLTDEAEILGVPDTPGV
jgi:hypothetical protein